MQVLLLGGVTSLHNEDPGKTEKPRLLDFRIATLHRATLARKPPGTLAANRFVSFFRLSLLWIPH